MNKRLLQASPQRNKEEAGDLPLWSPLVINVDKNLCGGKLRTQ